jgi:hypothetical protein
MTVVTDTVGVEAPAATAPRPGTPGLTALLTLARRRLALTVRTPRQLLIPLLAPLLFAVVVAPALGDTFDDTIPNGHCWPYPQRRCARGSLVEYSNPRLERR